MCGTCAVHLPSMWRLRLGHMLTTCKPCANYVSATCQLCTSHMLANCRSHPSHALATCNLLPSLCWPHEVYMHAMYQSPPSGYDCRDVMAVYNKVVRAKMHYIFCHSFFHISHLLRWKSLYLFPYWWNMSDYKLSSEIVENVQYERLLM